MTQPSTTADATFKADLVLLIPQLRAFAYSLAKRPNAEDLAQEALLRAWRARATYKPGSDLKAWTFTILRNLFLSDKRRDWRTQPIDPLLAENTMAVNDDPHASEELLDVRNAMQLLPDFQRETLILLGPAGLSYEEVAKAYSCAVGTVKSRVSRGRAALTVILNQRRAGQRARSAVSSSQVFEEIMADAARLQRRLELA